MRVGAERRGRVMMGYGKWWWWYCRLRGGFGGKEGGLVVFDRGQRKGRVKGGWTGLGCGLFVILGPK